MFINISNHRLNIWSEKQIKAAKLYGNIVDMPFPEISPITTNDEMERLVDEYEKKIIAYKNPIVLVQGEFVFTYRLVTRLKKRGIKVVSACSRRIATEEISKTGEYVKKAGYEFSEFREF